MTENNALENLAEAFGKLAKATKALHDAGHGEMAQQLATPFDLNLPRYRFNIGGAHLKNVYDVNEALEMLYAIAPKMVIQPDPSHATYRPDPAGPVNTMRGAKVTGGLEGLRMMQYIVDQCNVLRTDANPDPQVFLKLRGDAQNSGAVDAQATEAVLNRHKTNIRTAPDDYIGSVSGFCAQSLLPAMKAVEAVYQKGYREEKVLGFIPKKKYLTEEEKAGMKQELDALGAALGAIDEATVQFSEAKIKANGLPEKPIQQAFTPPTISLQEIGRDNSWQGKEIMLSPQAQQGSGIEARLFPLEPVREQTSSLDTGPASGRISYRAAEEARREKAARQDSQRSA